VKVIVNDAPKAEEFLLRFCDEEQDRLPQIAISVDMMDTGIDAPKVVNLVFYKPVKSYSKFWQMIGRGSRLSPDLFGPGRDKDKFLIFDLCENFDFFRENPKGIENATQQTLSQTLFNLKLQLAEGLKGGKYNADTELQQYRTGLLNDLHKQVADLDCDRFEVKMKMKAFLDFGGENREVWNHLTNTDLRRIKEDILPLIRPVRGEDDLARYYDKLLYTIIQKRIETPESDKFISSFENQINRVGRISHKLLQKTSIPQVKNKEELIKQPLQEDFWKSNGVGHLEKVRANLRLLIRYIDREDLKYVMTNFEDEIQIDKIKVETPYDVAKEKGEEDVTSSIFKNNVYRLEEIIRENENHITIRRIKNHQTITNSELKELENFLFNGNISKEEFEKEYGQTVDLARFIVSLIGLSPECVDKEFAQFTNSFQLNSKQIQFLDTMKRFLTKNGKIDPAMLYESPFVDIHNLGIDGVFNEKQADRIFEIIDGFKEHSQITG